MPGLEHVGIAQRTATAPALPAIQRRAVEPEPPRENIQRIAATASAEAALDAAVALRAASHGGEPLSRGPDATGIPAPVRAKMEGALGADFSDVRVHPGSAKAVELSPLAFTQGSDIHVAPGQWAPETTRGDAVKEQTPFAQGHSGEVSEERGVDRPSGNATSVRRKKADVDQAPNSEQTWIQTMIAKGQKDETGLTNAVFYTRHPELSGKVLAKGSPLAKEWLSIRSMLVRPTLSASANPPAVTTPPPLATAKTAPAKTAAPSESGLIQQGIDAVSDVAQSAYNAVVGWFSSNDQATPVAQPAPVPEQTGAVKWAKDGALTETDTTRTTEAYAKWKKKFNAELAKEKSKKKPSLSADELTAASDWVSKLEARERWKTLGTGTEPANPGAAPAAVTTLAGGAPPSLVFEKIKKYDVTVPGGDKFSYTDHVR
jgi:hypothetical protein